MYLERACLVRDMQTMVFGLGCRLLYMVHLVNLLRGVVSTCLLLMKYHPKKKKKKTVFFTWKSPRFLKKGINTSEQSHLA